MSDCDCGSPFGYEMTTPSPNIEGNGMFVYPECPRKRWIHVATAARVSLGIAAENEGDTSGYLYAWGDNRNGCLGNGTYDNSDTPVLVGGDSKWKFATTDGERVLAIKDDGSLWGWGRSDTSGCLGIGQRASRWWYASDTFQDFSSILRFRAKISSSVEYVVAAYAFPGMSVFPPIPPGVATPSQQYMTFEKRGPRRYWHPPYGGYMAPPTLRVETISPIAPAGGTWDFQTQEIGSGCTVEPIFEAEVVGLMSESATWGPLNMMPTVTSGGSGYTSPPTVTISGGGGAGATAKANIANGSVVSIELLSGGRGYQSRPTVEFSGGGGTGATAEVFILGKVYGARVTNGGSGYTSSVYVPPEECAYSIGITGSPGPAVAADVYHNERFVCVKATRDSGDDFATRMGSVAREGATPYLDVVGICGLSPSEVVAIESPNVPISDVPPEGYLFGDRRVFPLSASVHLKALRGDNGVGATATASASAVDEYSNGVPRRRIVVSRVSGGFGYRAEPRIIVGERSTPELIDSGSWSDVAIHSQRSIGAKSDGSIWVWGMRIAHADWWFLEDGGNNWAYDSENGDASPVSLGRWIQIKGYEDPVPNLNATPPGPWPPSGLGSSGGVRGIPMPLFSHTINPLFLASVPGYTTAPSLTPVGDPSGNTFSFALPPDAKGNPRSATISGFGSPTAELDGPADARRVYSHGGYRYVIDTGGVLWKLGDGLSSVSNAPGVTSGYRTGTVTTVGYSVSGYGSGDEPRGSDENDTISCDTPPNPNTSTTTDSTSLTAHPQRVTRWKVYGGAGLSLMAKIRLQWEDQTLNPSTTTSTSEEVWSGTCTVTGSHGGSSTFTIKQNKITTVVTHGDTTPTSDEWEIPYVETWGGGLWYLPPTAWPGSYMSVTLQSVYDDKAGQWKSPSQLGVTLETYRQPPVNRGGGSTTYARCGGNWNDYCPQFRTGILADGRWMCNPVFEGREDVFFAGIPMPADFSADLGPQQRIMPGGLVVDSSGRLWRLPLVPQFYSSNGSVMHHGTPPARIAPLAATTANSGSGIVTPPVVSATQSPLTATATASFDGKLYAVGVIDGGSGYASPPTVTFQGGGGSGGEATAVIQGPLANLSLDDGGDGYRSSPDVVFNGTGIPAKAKCSIAGGVSEIRIASGGYGYYTPPTVTIEGDGQGATATAEIQGGGKVDEISLRNSGSGYTSAPTVSITGGGGSGASAEAVVDLNEESANYGKVTSVSLTSRGIGYTSRPSVEITGGGGTGAKAEATIASDGVVSSITIQNTGVGYTSPPQVRIAGGGGSGASAAAIISGSVNSVSLVRGGKYRTQPTFSFRVQKEVSSITLTESGSGYTTPPSVLIVGGQGGGASATAILESTLQNAVINVTDGGSGYTSPPKVTFTGGGAFARGTATVSGGIVTGVTITEYGSGFSSSPSVSFSGGGGSGASAVVKLPLASVSLISGGSGYTSPPVVLFFGGGGTGAAAEATIADMPGSGGGGTSQINGSVIFVDVTDEGSNYHSHPIAIASPPDFPWGQTAAIQAKIVGTVTGINVTNGGDKYSWWGAPALPSVRHGSRLSEAEVFLRGTPCDEAETSTSLVYGANGYHSSVKVAEGGAIGSVASNVSIGDTGQLWWRARPANQVYYYSKPEVCFNDTIAVSPVVELTPATAVIGKDFRSLSFPISDRSGVLHIFGTGESPLCTQLFGDVNAYCLDDMVSGQKANFLVLLSLFNGNKYSTPPTVELVDVVGSGAACQLSLDQDGFVVEDDLFNTLQRRGPVLHITSSGNSRYSSEMGLVLSGGVPLLISPVASCTIDDGGSVSSVTLSGAGGGFSRPPLVYVTGGGGAGASVAVEMGDEYPLSTTKKTKKVVGITLLSGGSGYSSVPQVVFVAQEPKLPELSSTSAEEVEDISLYEDPVALAEKSSFNVWYGSGRVAFDFATAYERTFGIERLRLSGTYSNIMASVNRHGFSSVCTQRDPISARSGFYPYHLYSYPYGAYATLPPNSRPLVVPFFSNGRLVGGHISTLREVVEDDGGSFSQGQDAGVFYRMRTHTPTVQTYDSRAGVPVSAVTAVQVTNGGSGYTYPPSVRFTGGGGAAAAAVAAINSDGAVASVFVTNGGWGYTGPPTISFVGDGGGASAVASLDAPPAVSIRQVVHYGVAAASDSALAEIGRDQRQSPAPAYKLVTFAQ